APKSLARRANWVDDASVGIPDLYTITALTLAETTLRMGRKSTSDSLIVDARGIATTTRRAQLFGLDKGNPLQPQDSAIDQLLNPRDSAPSSPVPAKRP
ncbi:MAG: hypothetical protein MUF00_02740, partial [Gemmatimonadaceae bacterium]|nr:hypothetical protein [Gemmatimonadaceae bacterium]